MGSPSYYTGVLLLTLAAVTYSTAGLFTRSVEAGSWEIIFWRGVFAGGFTTLWILRKGALRREFLGMGRSGLAVGIIGALGTAAFIPAFKLTSIANVSLIYAAAPLLAALFAWGAIGERASPRTLAGSVAALAGVAVIVAGSLRQGSVEGDLLALWMTIAMATIMVIYRAFPDTPGAGPAALQSVLLLPAAATLGAPFAVSVPEIAILASFGLLFAISSVALAEGAKRVPAAQTALLSALETPLAPALAFLLLAEVPAAATGLGGAVVFLAVIFTIRRAA